MTVNFDGEKFDQIIKGFDMNSAAESVDTNPYGAPAPAHKAGLTKRGKAALGIGVAVIAGSGLVGYQVYSANTAASEAKAQEIALKSQVLELEKLRELNRASEVNQTVAVSQDKARQASVDKCVKGSAHLVGKGFGSPSHRDIVDDCQAQYPAASTGDDMAEAASSKTTNTGGGGGTNGGLLIGGAALAVFFVAAAKKGSRSNAA